MKRFHSLFHSSFHLPLSILLIMPVLFSGAARASESGLTGTVERACSDQEKWSYPAGWSADVRGNFDAFLNDGRTLPEAFGQAFASTRAAASVGQRLFAEYAMGRVLFQAGLQHAAFDQFAAIASQPVSRETLLVQRAALQCADRILTTTPSLELPHSAVARLPEYLALEHDSARKPLLWDLTIQALQASLVRGDATAQSAVGWLRGAGAWELIGQALVASNRNDHAGVVTRLEPLLVRTAAKSSELPASQAKSEDLFRLILARAYFAQKQLPQAMAQYQKVDHGANEFPRALTELAWSYLAAQQYKDSIGVGIGIQSGALRAAFVPEGPMVLAMSLNELCQFPQALRVTRSFQRDYASSRQWLKNWTSESAAIRPALYGLAVAALKDTKDAEKLTGVPARVTSEWLRSPVFIANQAEISQLFKEQKMALEVQSMSAHDSKIAEMARSTWESVLSQAATRTEARKSALVQGINADLAGRSRKMLAQLDDVATQNGLVEIEILNGASHDLIFRNAHPEYAKAAKDLGEQEADHRKDSQVWNWGRVRASDPRMEIWEDELGSMSADTYDNCKSKDKYLTLRLNAGAEKAGQKGTESE